MSSPLIGVSFINGLVFGVQPHALDYFGDTSVKAHFAAGFIAGAVQAFAASPMELAKTQMQVQGIGLKAGVSNVSSHLVNEF